MISLIEARHYRCLRYIKQELGPFHILVGPNASGKTTFLDVVAFLSRLVSDGLEDAIEERTATFSDLVWWHEPGTIELAIESPVPESVRNNLAESDYEIVRYEIAIEYNPESNQVEIVSEQGFLKHPSVVTPQKRLLFPQSEVAPDSILVKGGSSRTRRLFSKNAGGNDNYYAEAHPKEGRWRPAFKLGPRKSTLGNLPEDEVNFPVSTWLKQFLTEGVQSIVLNSATMRKPSPPGQGTGFRPDGSNLPWVVDDLIKRAPERFREWISHLQTALYDLEDIRTVQRSEDHFRYLVLHYKGGLEVPSWMVSDGTLRLLALTLPAYLRNLRGTFLIEEPENGIHPRAVETMYQSLSSVYDAQILLATHSPIILSIVEPDQVLCFAKTSEGATDIVPGDEHPKLRDWHGEQNLSVLFAAGVLG